MWSSLRTSTNRAVTQVPRYDKRLLSSTFENPPYDLHRLEVGPETKPELTREDALTYYRDMRRIRYMEQELGILYTKKIARGFCHLYSGQEAVGVGIKSMMLPQDSAITSYRCHAWALLMGAPMECIVSEVIGRKSGCSRGKGGSMHVYAPNFYGGNGIVGAQLPLGTGIGLAHQYRKDGGVCVTLYGDGASDQGQTYEAMNFAKLLNLPVLYVVENNIYSMGTSLVRHSSNRDLYTRGESIPGIRMDGMDVLSVREGAKFCLDYIRKGNGPLVLELMTYRYFGHSMSDPGTTYRTRDEVQQVRETRDPIMLLKKKMSINLATEDELKVIDKEVKVEVDVAMKKGLSDKEIDVEEVAYDIYVKYRGKVKMPGHGKFIQHKNAGVMKVQNP